MRWLRQAVTDYDNHTVDTGRLIAVFLVCSMVLLQAWATYKSGTFDPMAFGGGTAAVLAALGVAIAGDNHKRP